jgi:hypothetical protein
VAWEGSVDKGAGMSGGAVVDEGNCDPEVQLAKIFSKILEVEVDPGKVKSMIAMLKILESSGLQAVKDVARKIEEEKLAPYIGAGRMTAANSYRQYRNASNIPPAGPGSWPLTNNKWPPYPQRWIDPPGSRKEAPEDGLENKENAEIGVYRRFVEAFRKKNKKS